MADARNDGGERRQRMDRRQAAAGQQDMFREAASQRTAFQSQERRVGPRRKIDLPRGRWHEIPRLLGSAIAGAVLVFTVRGVVGNDPEDTAVNAGQSSHRAHAGVLDDDANLIANARALRETIEQLTATDVVIDESATQQWLPRMPELWTQAHDPSMPSLARVEYAAALEHLERIGMTRGGAGAIAAPFVPLDVVDVITLTATHPRSFDDVRD